MRIESYEHLALDAERRLLARDRVQAAQQQLAQLGVDDAEGELDGHAATLGDRHLGYGAVRVP